MLRSDVLRLAALAALAACDARPAPVATGTGPCLARPQSLTPPDWPAAGASDSARRPPLPGLRVVADLPLPAPAARFDYQSLDPASNRLWISHMDADRVLVIDLGALRVVGEVGGLRRVTGILAVPGHHRVYASAAGTHEVAAIDDTALQVASRAGGIQFPDGLALAPDVDKLFVSDESGRASVVLDAATGAKRSRIALGGEAGNTHYDPVSRCILVAVQTRGQLAAIDPATERVVARYDVPGVDGPHGFALDPARRLAFVTGEGNGALAVLSLRTMRVVQRLRVGDGPDVLAWDPDWRRLYVGSEAGILSAFWAAGDTLLPLGDLAAPRAHTVSVDPRTHRVYLPLESVGGRPLLRVLEPSP